MIKQIRRRIFCLLHGHDWDRVHGYNDIPVNGALCNYCGDIN